MVTKIMSIGLKGVEGYRVQVEVQTLEAMACRMHLLKSQKNE
ncbi:hypothetical protein [Bacillus sp. Marseille-P3661]|nr:hypothetical protein [Bacillus sp. Marseille-P3661]